jgi:hypothetical protein
MQVRKYTLPPRFLKIPVLKKAHRGLKKDKAWDSHHPDDWMIPLDETKVSCH